MSAAKKFIVTYEGQEYNIKTFVEKHPGGKEVIEKYENKDITAAFQRVGHSEEAKAIMQRYLVVKGGLGGTGSVSVSSMASSNTSETEYGSTGTPRKKADLSKYGLKYTTKKLFTEEDKYFFHKTFGFISLFSFIYRYAYVLPTTGTLGFGGHTAFDYATLFVHMMLSASSLIFHVLGKLCRSNVSPSICLSVLMCHYSTLNLVVDEP